MKKISAAACIAAVTCILVLFMSNRVFAETPYKSYTYNQWGQAVEAPHGYLPKKFIDGAAMGSDPLDQPRDLFFDKTGGLLYIADTGNNRIIVLNKGYTLEFTIESVITPDGAKSALRSPSGIFVDADGVIYIADTKNARVIKCDQYGQCLAIIGAPSDPALGDNFDYQPAKLVIDDDGLIYVQANNVYQGMLCMDQDGNFIRFFGANRVDITAQILFQQFMRNFMTKQQRKGMFAFIPTEYSNMYIDSKGFIYAVVSKSQNSLNEIKKINSLGDNVLRVNPYGNSAAYLKNDYGDFPVYYTSEGKPIDTSFIDIHYDEANGMIAALDATRGRVFVYDNDSNLMFTFGVLGKQLGSFTRPVSIEKSGSDYIVLDGETGGITIFSPTEYGNNIINAVALYEQGRYLEAMEPWQKVLSKNSNYNLAYDGIGKSYLMLGDYKNAMKYLKLAYDKASYSQAQDAYNTGAARANMPLIAVIVLLVGIFPFVLPSLLKLKKKYNVHYEPSPQRLSKVHFTMPFYAVFHPIDAFEVIRYKKINSYFVNILILAVYLITEVVYRKNAGFIFNYQNPDTVSIYDAFIGTIGIIVLAVSANFLLCTFMDGEGKFKEIFAALSYGTLILTFQRLGALVLTNVMSIEMAPFFVLYNMIFYTWFAAYILMSDMTVHQFGFLKTIANIFFTIVMLALMAGLILLLYSLFGQLASFFYTIYNEIQFRL